MKKCLIVCAIVITSSLSIYAEDLRTIQGLGTYVFFKDSFSKNYGLRLDSINWTKKYQKGGKASGNQLDITVNVAGCTKGLMQNPIKLTIKKDDWDKYGVGKGNIFYISECNTEPQFTIKEDDVDIAKNEPEKEILKGSDWSKVKQEEKITEWSAQGFYVDRGHAIEHAIMLGRSLVSCKSINCPKDLNWNTGTLIDCVPQSQEIQDKVLNNPPDKIEDLPEWGEIKHVKVIWHLKKQPKSPVSSTKEMKNPFNK